MWRDGTFSISYLDNDSFDECCENRPEVTDEGKQFKVECRLCGDHLGAVELWRLMINWNLRQRSKFKG